MEIWIVGVDLSLKSNMSTGDWFSLELLHKPLLRTTSRRDPIKKFPIIHEEQTKGPCGNTHKKHQAGAFPSRASLRRGLIFSEEPDPPGSKAARMISNADLEG